MKSGTPTLAVLLYVVAICWVSEAGYSASQQEDQACANDTLPVLPVYVELVPLEQMLHYRLPDGSTADNDWYETHGTLKEQLSRELRRISARACDEDWNSSDEVQSFVWDALADQASQTFTAPVWAHQFRASIICDLEYRDGTRKSWIVGADRATSFFTDMEGNPWFATHVELAQRYPVERGDG